MNAEGRADGVPEFLGANFVLTRKDFDPIDLLERSLDRYVQPEGEIVYIDTAQFRRQRFLAQNPEVRAAARHLDDGVNSILFEFPLQRPEIPVSSVVVGVDGDPFRSLGLLVDGIKTDGLDSCQMFPDHLIVERVPFLGLAVARLVEVILP